MAKNTSLRQLDLLMLPANRKTLNLDNEIILSDNIDYNDIIENRESTYIGTNYPVKITFTIIIFCTQGFMRFRINLIEYELRENDALLILPNTIGEYIEISPQCRLETIAFSNPIYEAGTYSRDMMLQKHIRMQSVVHLSPEAMQECKDYYGLMRKKIEDETFAYKKEAISGLLQVMFCNIFQALGKTLQEPADNKKESRQRKIFNRFLASVQQHYTKERNLTFYADKLYITPKYLSQVVFAESGRHAGEWIKDYVILEAKALLNTGEYTVQQISDMLNFANSSFFCKYFRAAAGCSPRKYQMGTK